MSLPSCIPQDQEFLPGQTGAGCKTQLLLNNRNQSGEKNEHEAQKQRPNFLPLAPVGAGTCVSVNTLDPIKGERSQSRHEKRTDSSSGDFVRCSEATDDGRKIQVKEELPRGDGVRHEHPLREIVDRDRAGRAHNGQRHGESSSFVESGESG